MLCANLIISDHSDESEVRLIKNLRHAVATGYIHVVFFTISLIWTVTTVYRSRNVKIVRSNFKASRISKRYELPTQVIRVTALAFSVITAVQADSQPWYWYNVVLVGCAVLFGLTRLTNNVKWRHIALHQINFLLAASLLLLAVGELLPMAALQSAYRPSNVATGALVSLGAAVLLALCTPREWSPPAVSFDDIKRPADAGPAPEEVCSWWTQYLTYEWLTPIIWKGENNFSEITSRPSRSRWLCGVLASLRFLCRLSVEAQNCFWVIAALQHSISFLQTRCMLTYI